MRRYTRFYPLTLVTLPASVQRGLYTPKTRPIFAIFALVCDPFSPGKR